MDALWVRVTTLRRSELERNTVLQPRLRHCNDGHLNNMRITIFNNQDGTFHVAIGDKYGQSDSTCDGWQAVLNLLASLKEVEIS